jgi:hypothetical protein
VEGAVVQTATHDISFFTATSQSNITIRGLHLKQTAAGSASGVAGVLLDRCTNCVVEECEFEGMQFHGIGAPGALYCTFRDNYFHNALGIGNSTSDIDLGSTTSASKYNVITGNKCWGGAEFGISVWDPDSGVLPSHNVVSNNRIGGGQTGYGIIVYMPDAGDTFNQIIGNSIQDVTGAVVGNTSAGAGIYVVGAGAGGTLVANNTIVNCCISTAAASLAPAGIGISGTSAGSAPVTVQGNVIQGMTQYHGILATGILGGITISGNTVIMPALNTTGDCIRVVNSANWTVSGNVLTQLNTTTAQRGILAYAQGANCIIGAIVGNTVNGGHQSYIETAESSSFLVSGLIVSGNVCNGGDNTCIPLLFGSASAADVLVTGNYFSGGSATVVSQAACTNVRYSNNKLKGTGTAILTTSGACTGSFYGDSNQGTGAGAGVVNGATGFIVEQLGTASPAAGTWAIGDKVRNTTITASGVFLWTTTTAGAGTWKTVSNT